MVPPMETEVLATLLGVALAALVAACGAGFRWMRSDFKRLEAKVDRLEAKVDNLIIALARAGILVDPQAGGPEPPAAGSPPTVWQPTRGPPAEPSGPTSAPA